MVPVVFMWLLPQTCQVQYRRSAEQHKCGNGKDYKEYAYIDSSAHELDR